MIQFIIDIDIAQKLCANNIVDIKRFSGIDRASLHTCKQVLLLEFKQTWDVVHCQKKSVQFNSTTSLVATEETSKTLCQATERPCSKEFCSEVVQCPHDD